MQILQQIPHNPKPTTFKIDYLSVCWSSLSKKQSNGLLACSIKDARKKALNLKPIGIKIKRANKGFQLMFYHKPVKCGFFDRLGERGLCAFFSIKGDNRLYMAGLTEKVTMGLDGTNFANACFVIDISVLKTVQIPDLQINT